MKKTLALILFLLLFFSSLFIFPSNFPPHQKPALAQTCQDDDGVCPEGCTLENDNDCAQSQIDLTASKKFTNTRYKKYVFPVQTPSQLNFLGLSGYVSTSSDTNKFYQALITIQNVPSGNCPPSGTIFDSYSEMHQQYPGVHPISSFILKGGGSGGSKRIEVPTDFTFPIEVPITGCIFVLLDSGLTVGGEPVTVESHMKLIYDTQPPPSPAPYFIILDYEFCYGRSGMCFLSTKRPTEENAFARTIKINSPLYLWSLSGDVSSASFTKPLLSEPDGEWRTDFDYYLYKSCPPPAIGNSGPSDYYSQIPDDAFNLLSFRFQGHGRNAFHQSTIKTFEPKLIEPGSCLVNLVRSVSEDGKGGISDESQIYALVQPVPPSFTIQGYKLGCPEGTKIILDGTEETTDQPYFFHNVPVGTHTVSLELPSDVPPYDISYSPCDCCINHPDESFISGSSHSFTKETTCYYDLYWQCTNPYDLNKDGSINSQDLKILLQNWLTPILGAADLNGDDQVNGLDFGMMISLIE